jgi:hypothetical protein
VRLKSILVVLLIAVAGTTATPVTGQEEPLPALVVKQSVFLAVEPVHGTAQPSLADAVRANDYPTFDALYREAVQRGESVGAYETLHELWTYSITDPIGAFYGDEMYERLARAYPGYARYMEDFRIVDSNGNAFYPTSETRGFLLSEALRGTPASPPAGRVASRHPVRATQVKAAARDAAGPDEMRRPTS